jgi:hypothetical protein
MSIKNKEKAKTLTILYLCVTVAKVGGACMKKIALFGAGEAGTAALGSIGSDLVRCFFVNKKDGDTIDAHLGLPVVSFTEFLTFKDEVYVIVASYSYYAEMCDQLESHGVHNYFVWNSRCFVCKENIHRLPRYRDRDGQWKPYSLARSFFNYDYSRYERLAVYVCGETADIVLGLLKAIGAFDKVVCILHQGEYEEKTFLSVKDNIDCMICAVDRKYDKLHRDYEGHLGITAIDLYDVLPFVKHLHFPQLRRFKDSYKDKRCFIIGNGPSLRIEDLETLHRNNEVTFACNAIFNVFEQTDWRPDFYCVSDWMVLKHCIGQILNMDVKVAALLNFYYADSVFIKISDDKFLPYYPNAMSRSDSLPKFSDDISIQVYTGATIACDLIQVAVYCGFAEIYLLGVDNDSTTLKVLSETAKHFYKNDVNRGLDAEIKKQGERSTLDAQKRNHQMDLRAFESAKKACEARGIKIRNATRNEAKGVFERTDFDSLFD